MTGPDAAGSEVAPTTFRRFIGLVAGFVLVFALLQSLASAMGSNRGEAGVLVTAVVVAALVALEGLLNRHRPLAALRVLGFGWPRARGMGAAMLVAAAMLAVIPLYAWTAGADFVAYPGWPLLVPGLLAQGGIAEEALFRGYLFGHLREGRGFWRAAFLSMLPFLGVHLFLFATLPWPVALASILLAAVISFPLARLYELGGRTIWAPAIVHFVVQGTVKVVEAPGNMLFPLVWIAAAAVIPYLVFLVKGEE